MAGSSIPQFKDGSAPVHDSTKIEIFPEILSNFPELFPLDIILFFQKKLRLRVVLQGSKDRQIARVAGVKPPK